MKSFKNVREKVRRLGHFTFTIAARSCLDSLDDIAKTATFNCFIFLDALWDSIYSGCLNFEKVFTEAASILRKYLQPSEKVFTVVARIETSRTHGADSPGGDSSGSPRRHGGWQTQNKIEINNPEGGRFFSSESCCKYSPSFCSRSYELEEGTS